MASRHDLDVGVLRIKIGIVQELLIIIGLSILLVLVIYVVRVLPVRVVIGMVGLLFLPGHVALTALFPGKDDLPGIERVTLSLVLSMAIVSLIALGLSFTPWGVRLEPILASVTSFILVAGGMGYFRRTRLQRTERFIISFVCELPQWRAFSWQDSILTGALSISLLFAGATVLLFLIVPKASERYTDFYLFGPTGEFGGYPTDVLANTPITVTLGVVNQEHKDAEYRIEKEGNLGRELLATLYLGHGETWEQPYAFTVGQAGENQKVEFLLYRGDEQVPLRSLYLRFTVREE